MHFPILLKWGNLETRRHKSQGVLGLNLVFSGAPVWFKSFVSELSL